MEGKRIIELLEFILKKEHNSLLNEGELSVKGFTATELNLCVRSNLIGYLSPNYFLLSNGINFLNQYYTSQNIEKLDKSINNFSKKSAEHSKKLNKTMEDFSDNSDKNSKKMQNYTTILIYLTIALAILTVVTIGYTYATEERHKTEEINKVIAQIEGLDLELKTILDGVDLLTNQKERFEVDNTPFQFTLENLKESSSNPNIRNEDIKNRIIVLNNRVLQINLFIEQGNPNVFDYFPKTEEIIIILREKLPKYRECLIEKRNFDKC